MLRRDCTVSGAGSSKTSEMKPVFLLRRQVQKSARTTVDQSARLLFVSAALSGGCIRTLALSARRRPGAQLARARDRGTAGRPPKEALGRGAGVSARKDMTRERKKVCAGVRARARAPARASASAQRTSAFAWFCSLEACPARRASPRATSSRFGRPWGILCHSDSLSPHRGALLRSLLSSLRGPGIESTSPSARLCSSP